MARDKDRNAQIRAESRARILAAAQRLFAERGYNRCSVSDIAQEARMSQGNIYWYFSSKQELFKTILAEGFEALGAVIAEAAARPGTAVEKLDALLEGFDALMQEENGKEFLTIITTLIARGGVHRFGELGLSTGQIGDAYHHSLNAIIAQGQAEGTIMTGIDPDRLTTFYFAFVNGLMLMYPDEWQDIPFALIREAVLRLLGVEGRPA
jgi:AcrR family transcriptional regulator